MEKKINDPIEIVDKFNDFFINVGPNLIKHVAQSINEIYCNNLNKSILASFHFKLIDENNEIIEMLITCFTESINYSDKSIVSHKDISRQTQNSKGRPIT